MMFKFYCDESYDGTPGSDKRSLAGAPPFQPRTLVVSGWFSDAATFVDIETRWGHINKKFNVSRFHASHLNARDHEYKGWDRPKQRQYSTELMAVIQSHGKKLYGFSCGMLADEYRSVISGPGQAKLGTPEIVCFKTCIAMVASEMNNDFPVEDQIEVIFDRGKYESEMSNCFWEMKAEKTFPYRSRLATCKSESAEKVIALQSADLIAYEVFRRLHEPDRNKEMRAVLARLYHENVIEERYFSRKTFEGLREGIDSVVCGPNQLTIIPGIIK